MPTTPSMEAIRAVVIDELARDSAGLATMIDEIRERLAQPGAVGATGVTAVPKEIERDRTTRLAEIVASFPRDERMR
jgi:hypothetical protein